MYSGSSPRMSDSVCVVCDKRDPSMPSVPGGWSHSLEWSLQGGAAVMRMMCVGS